MSSTGSVDADAAESTTTSVASESGSLTATNEKRTTITEKVMLTTAASETDRLPIRRRSTSKLSIASPTDAENRVRKNAKTRSAKKKSSGSDHYHTNKAKAQVQQLFEPSPWDEYEQEMRSNQSMEANRNSNANMYNSSSDDDYDDDHSPPASRSPSRNRKGARSRVRSGASKQIKGVSTPPPPQHGKVHPPSKLPTLKPVKKTESEMSNAVNLGVSVQYRHPFFSLPETVRVKILKYLSPTERLLAQFVCRRFRNDIRLRVGIRTKVTEDTVTGLTFLRDVLVTSILVGKYDRPMSAPSKLIYNPENIQEIVFTEPICIQNLDAFLNRCRKIKWLIIHTSVVDQASPSTSKAPYAGYEWRSLDIINRYPVHQPALKEVVLCVPGSHCLRTVNRALALLNTPALERFSLIVNQPIAFEETTAVHFAVLNYLKNCLSVSHVIICTEQRSSTLRYASRSSYVVALERELNQFVEKLHLKHLVLTEPAVAFETWNIVLNNQNALEVLQVLHMTIWPLLRDIIMINFKTLVKVALHAILWDKYGKHSPVDLNVFNRSNSLKELYICVAGPPAEGNTSGKDKVLTDFINFNKLPKNLETFALKHCHVLIRDFLFIRNLAHLKSLGIVSLGSSDGNYIGVKTLRKLVHMRSLEELFISGLVADTRDSEDLKNVMMRLKAKVNQKRKNRHVFHCYTGLGNRWSVTKHGSFVFTIFSDWGFTSY